MNHTLPTGPSPDPRLRFAAAAALAALSAVGCVEARRDLVREPAPGLRPSGVPAARGADPQSQGDPTGSESAGPGSVAPDAATQPPVLAGTTPGTPLDGLPGGPVDQADAPEEGAPSALEASAVLLREQVSAVLDDWHEAASVGDRERYIGHFALDAVFLGTDRTERWDLAEFTNYVDTYFKPGKGWTYVPVERFVILGPERRVAWFDERLSSGSYGEVRGTGVLRLEEDGWRIAHYSMTFTVPNGVAGDVVDVIRAFEE